MSPNIHAKTFFLNERHELSQGERVSRGRTPRYAEIDWHQRGHQISASLQRVKQVIRDSDDPAKDNHFFVLAKPAREIVKLSEDRKKAPSGLAREAVRFSDQQSRIFSRLDMDLLRVTESGSAVVHMKPSTLEKLSNTSAALHDLGPREQARWVALDDFDQIPPEVRIDSSWIASLRSDEQVDSVIEFQPFLTRFDIDRLLRSIAAQLTTKGERITGTGTDFSGRQWVRGKLLTQSLSSIASRYFSVQSLHSPLVADAAKLSLGVAAIQPDIPSSGSAINQLPTIGVIDTGVVADHAILADYRRGAYVAPNSYANNPDPHACSVASRVVFGGLDLSGGIPTTLPGGSARFYDMNICGINPGEVDTKSVFPALLAVTATAPDVRVFNCSFDTSPLSLMGEVQRSEYLSLVQDLDNFVFQNDILVVIAAGNSGAGVIPTNPYPNHGDETPWGLGAWARSFNSLTCGSIVNKLHSEGLVKNIGWPSPFSRVGPGMCNSAKPDFVADGGNCTGAYRSAPGLGVWFLSPTAQWEDGIGTSLAAPLLSREVAFALQRLEAVCTRGSRPFAVTVKAFLALTAEQTYPEDLLPLGALASRGLGFGVAVADSLSNPQSTSAVFIWQGVLEDDKAIAKVQIPIPKAWIDAASMPSLRIIVCSDPPVNAALADKWATRKVSCHIRPQSDVRAISPQRSDAVNSYPLFERLYKIPKGKTVDDTWLIDLSYEQIGDYYPVMEFSPIQRVAFAAELVDLGSLKVSPQEAIQAMPLAETMNRLAIQAESTKTPVFIRTVI